MGAQLACIHADLSPREAAAERNSSVTYREDHGETSKLQVASLGLMTNKTHLAAVWQGLRDCVSMNIPFLFSGHLLHRCERSRGQSKVIDRNLHLW